MIAYGEDFPDPLDGAALLDELHDAIKRYVVLPSEHAVTAVVLWTVATHGLPAFEHATRLAVHSATKRCGKSRLREVVEVLVHKSLSTTNISTPALFRIIDSAGDRPPTLMLDEADRLFGSVKKDEDNGDLIQLLNNGFRQGSPTWRCVGPQQTPTPFSNYAMVMLLGIGRKPETIEDRAVNITMRRRLPGESVAKFRLKTDVPALVELRERIAAWAESNLAALERPVEDIPDGLEDRQEDAWEPLLAVADAAGDEWPLLARTAAVELSRQATEDEGETLDVRLLHDVQDIFTTMQYVSFLATAALLTELRKIEDAPWHDLDLTGRKLALRMGKFEVKPRHNSAKTERGYHLEDLLDAFKRYPRAGTRPNPSDPSGAPESLTCDPDGLGGPDGSTRPEVLNRPAPTPGNTGLGRVRTVPDATPGDEDEEPDEEPATPARPGNPLCTVCGKPNLFARDSIKRGICASCAKVLDVGTDGREETG